MPRRSGFGRAPGLSRRRRKHRVGAWARPAGQIKPGQIHERLPAQDQFRGEGQCHDRGSSIRHRADGLELNDLTIINDQASHRPVPRRLNQIVDVDASPDAFSRKGAGPKITRQAHDPHVLLMSHFDVEGNGVMLKMKTDGREGTLRQPHTIFDDHGAKFEWLALLGQKFQGRILHWWLLPFTDRYKDGGLRKPEARE